MGFKCGIVGLPNVGKSTLFNALTATAAAEAANFPFCTIEPNVGLVGVPDERLHKLAQLAGSAKVIPAQMEFVDIAGLVAGAHKGEGLGNQFLANIREVDAIVHVVRCFENSDITHVAGKIDPLADIETINTELMLADLSTVEKLRANCEKKIKSGDKNAKLAADYFERLIQALENGNPARSVVAAADERAAAGPMALLSAKPVLYVCNVNEEDAAAGNAYTQQVADYAIRENAQTVVISAAIEAEIAQLDDAEKNEFLASMNLQEPGLNRLIRAGYSLLKLQTFFTAGPKEARAWTIRKGSTAPQAAGRIHTDFERGFIKADTIAFNDYVASGSEQKAKEAGKLRQEGKEYVVQDGDVMLFKFNV